MRSEGRTNFFVDPAPTVSLDSRSMDGEYTPVQRDQMDLASKIDSAYSKADWTNTSSIPGYSSTANVRARTPTSTQAADKTDSLAEDLAALDSLYATLSTLGIQQVKPDVPKPPEGTFGGELGPSALRNAGPPERADAARFAGHGSPQFQGIQDFRENLSGKSRSPHSVPSGKQDMYNSSMAAARSAVIEMKNQGLTYQNIEELVQNIQNLLHSMREKQNIVNVVNNMHMDEQLREAILQSVQSGNPHAVQDASLLFAAAAGVEFPQHVPPEPSLPHHAHHYQHPYSPVGQCSTAPHPFTPDASPIPSLHTPLADAGTPRAQNLSVHKSSGLSAIHTSHHAQHQFHDDPIMCPPYSSPMMSAHSGNFNTAPSYPPEFSPPVTPQVPYHVARVKTRNPVPQPIHTPQSPLIATPVQSRQSPFANRVIPQTPPTPTDCDAMSDRYPKGTFNIQSLQSVYECKAASEPLPGVSTTRGGTGVFIPGLHKQPLSSVKAPPPSPGASAPLSACSVGTRSGRPGHFSAPLSDMQCAFIDCEQVSPDSLAGSSELTGIGNPGFDASSIDKGFDILDRATNPNSPLGDPSDMLDPPAYSSSFFTQEPEEQESRELNSGSFRQITSQPYLRNPVSEDLSLGYRSAARDWHATAASAPIPEKQRFETDEIKSLSASLSPHSRSTGNIHEIVFGAASAEAITDSMGHLSLGNPKGALMNVGTPKASASATSSRVMRRSKSDRGYSQAAVNAGGTPSAARRTSTQSQISRGAQIQNPMSPSAFPSTQALMAAGRLDVRSMQAGECIPLHVTQWSQDHATVALFLHLEKFNPASLMVQIQQHMVVVMAMSSTGPSHVFMMQPEHAVRVQGSKSRPQPGSGIQIILQKRSPGNMWSTYGTVSTPQA